MINHGGLSMNEGILLFCKDKLTDSQAEELKYHFGIYDFIYPSKEYSLLWNNINPLGILDLQPLKELKEYVASFLEKNVKYIFFEGDRGAEYYMVKYAFSIGMIPLYATVYDTLSAGEHDRNVRMHMTFRKYVND